MKENKADKVLVWIFLAGIIAGLFVNGFGYIFKAVEPNNQTITFNITGINNTEDTGTLAQLHFECIKWCGTKYDQRLLDCWDQCSTLGEENE
jgi:hypothetical protein